MRGGPEEDTEPEEVECLWEEGWGEWAGGWWFFDPLAVAGEWGAFWQWLRYNRTDRTWEVWEQGEDGYWGLVGQTLQGPPGQEEDEEEEEEDA